MTLPAAISATALWSDNNKTRHGPFEASGGLYAFGVDKTANKIRVGCSTDGGLTWAEQDAANAPASATAAGYKSIDALLRGTDLYAVNTKSASEINILKFQTASNTWTTAITGPTITVGGQARVFLQLITVSSVDYLVVFYQGATETVMGTAYDRAKVHLYNLNTSTWTGPFDVVGSANSPLANTLPGTQVSYSVQHLVRGAADRVHLFWFDGTGVRTRGLTLNAFTGATITPTTDTSVAIGVPTTYVSGSATGVALPYGITGASKTVRCNDSTTADTVGNWVTQTVDGSQSPERTFAPPGAMCADTSKLWHWGLTDAQNIFYTDDAGAGAWAAPTTWKEGNEVYCAGLNAARVTDAIGVVYYDQLGVPVVSQLLTDGEATVGEISGSGNRRAQSFQFSTARTLKAVRLRLRKVGTPAGAFEVDIRNNNAGVPAVTALATMSLGASIATTDTQWYTFKLGTGIALTANTPYWFVLLTSGTSASAYYAVEKQSTSVYADGSAANGTNVEGWTVVSGEDYVFMLYTTEDSPERLRYDRVEIYRPVADEGTGEVSQEVDSGQALTSVLDAAIDVHQAGGDLTGEATVRFLHRGLPEEPWTELWAHDVEAGAAVRGTQRFYDVRQYRRCEIVRTTAASSAGLSGVEVV